MQSVLSQLMTEKIYKTIRFRVVLDYAYELRLKTHGPTFRALPRKVNFTSCEWRHFESEAARSYSNPAQTQQISLREKYDAESCYFNKGFLYFDHVEMQTEG